MVLQCYNYMICFDVLWLKGFDVVTVYGCAITRLSIPLMFTPVNLPWFSKGKEKEREKEERDKDRQQNGHRFSTGSCAGPTVCLVCDKPATGKELLHCSSK